MYTVCISNALRYVHHPPQLRFYIYVCLRRQSMASDLAFPIRTDPSGARGRKVPF